MDIFLPNTKYLYFGFQFYFTKHWCINFLGRSLSCQRGTVVQRVVKSNGWILFQIFKESDLRYWSKSFEFLNIHLWCTLLHSPFESHHEFAFSNYEHSLLCVFLFSIFIIIYSLVSLPFSCNNSSVFLFY